MGGLKWLVLWSLWATRIMRQPTPPVLTSSGWVTGSVAHAGTHNEYLGIPYASVVKRFQAPGPAPKWDGVFEAVEEYIRCRQPSLVDPTLTSGQENCLVLNIYTPPNASPDAPIPVMVFFHGGGFISKSNSRMIYGPEFLVRKGVVLISINYRLNMHGFLCLRTKEAPGNAGMKDQVAALRWIKRNIQAFGGDPDNVTLVGESAGAAAVSIHVLSPMSKGLFHKTIAQSGSSLASWAFQYDPLYAASLSAKTLGLDSMDANALYEFFMTKTDSELVLNRVPRVRGKTITSELLYTPCAEKIIEGEEPFLTELPYDILAKGKYNRVPMIVGVNAHEGLLFTFMESQESISRMVMEKQFPNDLDFPSNAIKKEVIEKLKELYLNKEEMSLKNKENISRLHADLFFDYPVSEELEILSKSSDQQVYSYVFSYESPRNIPKLLLTGDLIGVKGATHADELFYLFKQPYMPEYFGTDMIQQLTTMWTNFAKYGDPTPRQDKLLPVRWPAMTAEDQRVFVIDKEFTTKPLWDRETIRYWRSVYSKYRRK